MISTGSSLIRFIRELSSSPLTRRRREWGPLTLPLGGASTSAQTIEMLSKLLEEEYEIAGEHNRGKRVMREVLGERR